MIRKLSSTCRNKISVQNLNYTTQSFIEPMLRPIDITRQKKSLRDKCIAEITYILSFDSVFYFSIRFFRRTSDTTDIPKYALCIIKWFEKATRLL